MVNSVSPNAKALGTVGRLIGTLFFSVFFLMGLGFEIMIMRETATNLATFSWSRTEATIVASEISPPSRAEDDPMLRVSYTYTYAGTSQTNNRIEANAVALETHNAYRLAEHYSTGKVVPCWVNPNNPSEAVLQRKSPATALIVLFPLIFVAVGGFGIWAMWRRPKTSEGNTTTPPLSHRTKNPATNRFAQAALFGVFLLIGLSLTYALFIEPMTKLVAARHWTPVPSEVISSRVKTHAGDDSTTYSVDVVYRYTYQGRTYTANRYHFMSSSSSGYISKAAIVNQLTPGTYTTCYVDPTDPTEAVLDRDATWGLSLGLIPLVFVAVGTGGLIFTLRQKPGHTTAFTAPSANAVSILSAAVNDNLPQTLKPSTSPKLKFFGILFGALFWNGIVSVFLYDLISNRHHGSFNWFLALFLTPFVAIGLSLIGAVFYQFMALFNPRPRLTISRSVLQLGDTIDLNWELDGRTDRLRRLQITLEGREEATYRRGTDTRTDKEVFTRIQITDTTDPITIYSSSARFHLPSSSMHSFASTNNKIVWVLKLHGDIPRWPDLNDEYPVTVAPHPLAP